MSLIMRIHKSGSELTSSQHKDGNTICYMIYKVLKIKINQLLRKNTSILVLRGIPPLDLLLKNLHLAVIFKANKKEKKDKNLDFIILSSSSFQNTLLYN